MSAVAWERHAVLWDSVFVCQPVDIAVGVGAVDEQGDFACPFVVVHTEPMLLLVVAAAAVVDDDIGVTGRPCNVTVGIEYMVDLVVRDTAVVDIAERFAAALVVLVVADADAVSIVHPRVFAAERMAYSARMGEKYWSSSCGSKPHIYLLRLKKGVGSNGQRKRGLSVSN